MHDHQPCSDAPDAPYQPVRLCVTGRFDLRVPHDQASTGAPVLDADGRRLLALLAVSATPPRRAAVAEALWPERSPDAALGTLAGVCDALAGLVVADGPDRVRLAERVEVDLAESLGRLRAWRRDPDREEATSADALVGALAEDVLPGWTEPWARQERERYQRVRLHALESLAQRLTESGRPDAAVRAARLVVDAEPLRESARRALIEAHLAAGHVAEAVAQYDDYVSACGRFGLPSAAFTSFFPPSPAWPVLHVRRPVHAGGAAVGRGLRLDAPPRRAQVVGGGGTVGVGAAGRG